MENNKYNKYYDIENQKFVFIVLIVFLFYLSFCLRRMHAEKVEKWKMNFEALRLSVGQEERGCQLRTKD